MKKFALGLSIVLLTTIIGCSNVQFIKAREGCAGGVFWDVCEDTDDPVSTPTLAIKGDKNAQEYPDYY